MKILTGAAIATLPPSSHLTIIEQALNKAKGAAHKSRAWSDVSNYERAQESVEALRKALGERP